MKITRLSSSHGKDIGSSQTIHIQAGSFVVALEKFLGVYGFRYSVTYGIKFGWHPYRG